MEQEEFEIDGKIETIALLSRQDERGCLVAVEGEKDIPFAVKRIFYIYGCDPVAVRGFHANRNSQFIMICIRGSVRVRTHDGKVLSEFSLDGPDIGLYLGTMTWKEMYDFSGDAILLVLSSAPYDPEEYIRDFGEYIKIQNMTKNVADADKGKF